MLTLQNITRFIRWNLLSCRIDVTLQRPQRNLLYYQQITDPVEIVEPPGSSIRVPLGQMFRLHCRTTLSNQLSWFLNNTLASLMNNFKFKATEDTVTNTRLHMLIQERATMLDSGTYTCRNAQDRREHDSVIVQVVNNGESIN